MPAVTELDDGGQQAFSSSLHGATPRVFFEDDDETDKDNSVPDDGSLHGKGMVVIGSTCQNAVL